MTASKRKNYYELAKGRGGNGKAAQWPGRPSDIASDMIDDWPYLRDFLCTERAGEMNVEPGTILIYLGRSGLDICLLDKQNCQKAFVTAPEFQELLRAVEKGLEEGSLRWVEDKKQKARSKPS